MLKDSRATFIAFFPIFLSTPLWAGTDPYPEPTVVEWSDVSVSGNGCLGGGAEITMTPDGKEIALIYKSLGFTLEGQSATSRFCRLTAKAKVSKGFYLDKLNQELHYQGTKSVSGSVLSVSVQSRFFGSNFPALLSKHASGMELAPEVVLFDTQDATDLIPAKYFCVEENSEGLLQNTVTATGQVIDAHGSVSLGVQGQTISSKVALEWLPCP